MSFRLSIENFSVLIIWVLLINVSPFQFYAIIPGHPYKALSFLFLSLISYQFYRYKKNFRFDLISLIIIVQSIYTSINICVQLLTNKNFGYEDTSMDINLIIQLISIFLIHQFIDQFIRYDRFIRSYVQVMVVIGILSFLALILIYFFGLPPISYTVKEGVRPLTNYVLTFTTGTNYSSIYQIIRPSGYFDEPGTLAYFIFVAFLLNKLVLKNPFYNRLLLLGGFSSLSLAFLILISLYYSLEIIRRGRIKLLIVLTTLILGLGFALTELKNENTLAKQIYDLTIYRLSLSSGDEKIINGDNRSEYSVYALKAFSERPFFGFGLNAHTNEKLVYFGRLCCNPFHPLAVHGIIGLLVYFAIFFFWGLKILKMHGPERGHHLVCWIVMLFNLFQRPGFISGPLGYIIFILLYYSDVSLVKKSYDL